MTMIAALILALAAQDRVTLKFQPGEGDTCTLNSMTTMELKAKVAGAKPAEMTFRNFKLCTTEYLEVKDGAVVRKLIEVTDDTDEHVADGVKQRSKNPTAGKKITVTIKDGKHAYEGAGDIDEKTLRRVADEDKFYQLLPKKEVAAGDSWTLTGKDLKEAFIASGPVEGSIGLTLKELREIDGRRCAVITMKWDIKGPAEDGSVLAVTLEGELTVDVKRGYLLSMRGNGKIVVSVGDEEVASGSVSYFLEQVASHR